MQRSALVFAMLLVVAAAGPAVGVGAATASDRTISTESIYGDHGHGQDSQAATCEFPYTETDATGSQVNLTSDPERIVTLNPSAAQTMWEIGAEDEVVGVSQYASYLDGADEKANVSGASGPDVERVLNATPDLVLVPNSSYGASAERVEQIRAQGIPVYVFAEPTSLEYVAEKTERVGRLTGNCEAGTARADDIRRSVEQMERALEDAERPVGLNVFYGYTSGEDTFIGELMRTGGLENGAADAGISGFQQINDEAVVEMNPDWIIVPTGSSVPDTAAYESTTAVQEDKIVRIETNLLQQPAPRSVQAAEQILEAVHPEAYAEYRSMQEDESTTASDQTTSTAEPESSPEESPATSSTESPGFGAVAGLLALAAAAMLATRR
ncbi:PGF-CTERM-anchored ABC transporter substrate-binding protein [Halobellus captivus]|uniref:PGF-CTERM-anchored ABC transporter substrate-binding protein n=1 Tax=Halobellus captivus TaxID=2592614 RepID=UPI0011A6DCA0|nr:PGF-CTERM-anchored ABC transporter substrate-binding protein [Halobellus captivus]